MDSQSLEHLASESACSFRIAGQHGDGRGCGQQIVFDGTAELPNVLKPAKRQS